MRRRYLLMLCLLSVPWLATADPVQLVPGPSCLLTWTYPEGVTILTNFAMWKRSETGSYPTLPVKIIPAMEALITRVQCDAVAWGAPGVYVVVVKAQGLTDEPSAPSNELLVRWGSPDDVAPIPPGSPRPRPPITFIPPRPPKLTLPPPGLPITPSPSDPPGGWISDTCQWVGHCRH